ncbi:MAG: DUF814 domain-containing protein [Pseudobdellovibrio sp.]
MKTPSFFELKTIVEFVAEELEESQLQEVVATEEGLVLGFYRFSKNPRMKYLIFDLDRPFPFLALLEENPWLKFKKTKPVGLFLSAHTKNQYFSSIELPEDLGRVVQLRIGLGDHQTLIEARLIPKQVNLIVHHQKKQISWFPVKPLAQNDAQYTENEQGEEIRSLSYLTGQWRRLRANFGVNEAVKKSSSTLSPFEKWVKNRQKDVEKKQKAVAGIQKQISQFQNEEWAEVGEFLKTEGLKKLKPEWSVYVDFEKSVSFNMQRCFEKAKQAKTKISGAQERLSVLRGEIAVLQDLSEVQFEKSLGQQQKKQKKMDDRKVEGRLRKFELPDAGLVAYMGKSAADNMTLLRNSKPHDLWLHLKDYPSAHAVIHRQKNQNLADSALIQISKWLVTEGLSKSQTEMGGKYAVVFVECRHVKPLKGDKMGRVTYHNARELLIAL